MAKLRYRETSASNYNVTISTLESKVRQSLRTVYDPNTQYDMQTPTTGSVPQIGTRKTISDWVTPGYHKLIKAGNIINNPLHIHEVSQEDPEIDVYYSTVVYRNMMNRLNRDKVEVCPYEVINVYGTQRVSTIANVDYIGMPADLDYGVVEAKAITKAWARVNESDMLALATAKESGKTAADLQRLARKTLKAIRFIRHPKLPKNLSRKKLSEYYKEAEDLYMQARYNLRPLYYDILGAMKVATGTSDTKRAYRNVRDRYTIRATSTDNFSNSDTLVKIDPRFPRVKLRIKRSSSVQVESKAGVLCSARDLTKWEQSGISLIPETVWELTPFSFILDWFGNFGEVISSWTPKPGIKILTSWVTTEVVKTQTITVGVDEITDITSGSNALGGISSTETNVSIGGTMSRIDRTVTRTPNPRRTWVPHLDVNLDYAKILDLAIIGKNLTKGIKTFRS